MSAKFSESPILVTNSLKHLVILMIGLDWMNFGQIVHFSRDCENLSFTVNHLLYCMRSFHLEAAHVSNSASKSQLLLFQSKFCFLLVFSKFLFGTEKM